MSTHFKMAAVIMIIQRPNFLTIDMFHFQKQIIQKLKGELNLKAMPRTYFFITK